MDEGLFTVLVASFYAGIEVKVCTEGVDVMGADGTSTLFEDELQFW
jgi:hypothetical protein